MRKGNLPAEVSSFVGRRHELTEAGKLLSSSRLVTLTGVGGVGKTRLALRVAEQARRAFADGVWLVELAELGDPALLVQTVADALRVGDHSVRSSLVALAEGLEDTRLLLILDNCEHVMEACAKLVSTLLAAAPGLRILATSRHPLRIEGEHILVVPALPLPEVDGGPHANGLAGNDAVSLFAERARAVDHQWQADADHHMTIARICHRLDGLPLAIELAAVRMRVLTPEQILQRLDDRFCLLVGGSRSAPPRHQTLRAAVDWSHALCSSGEQVLWARASVFAGGFDLDAAQAVCSGDGIDRDRVMDLVGGLVDKSILVRDLHGSLSRYRMLDSIRHYGLERLSRREEETTRRRHRDFYLMLAERHETEWFGPTQADVFFRTQLEHANLRAALEFCLHHPSEAATGLRLAGALWFYWVGCGFLREGRHWLDRVLAADREPSPERAKALWVNGYVAALQGDVMSSRAMLEECLECARQVGDPIARAHATHRLGCNALVSDHLQVAAVFFEQARVQYLRLGEMSSNVLMAWNELAVTILFLGELDHAAALGEEARAAADAHGEQWARAYAIYVLALVALSRGEYGQATVHGLECLRTVRVFNDLLGIALAIEVLAWIAVADGLPERAGILLGAAGRIWPSVGFPMFGSTFFGAPHQQCATATRQALGEHGFDAAVRRGRAYDREQAIAYALDEPGPAPPVPATERPTPLTRRELDVAELVAEGLSNKQIADRLVIAQRTAEGHVQRVLTKLGFTTRTQLATWITERRS
ncbi:LuxR C-terminal-related transcriptional regulator [Kibdelosporangium philippinense]|uniref:LuxR C-terminal-related transcriptional regulator n=1 Tax=Kibdelosporangium philippinense TaxID=211113 RepID=A0ABS8ZGS1_9PSEU|nr:LuxR C-terminal-related transcriptional regulator [Kibdelosporangium philippinense]MCE7007020.1 LuxR C-terminal-related transcriptional regulator [Kibdelosporangium philippinense]